MEYFKNMYDFGDKFPITKFLDIISRGVQVGLAPRKNFLSLFQPVHNTSITWIILLSLSTMERRLSDCLMKLILGDQGLMK